MNIKKLTDGYGYLVRTQAGFNQAIVNMGVGYL